MRHDTPPRVHRSPCRQLCAALVVCACGVWLHAQGTTPTARADDDRMRQLQAEMDRLARESRTLLGELRTLELEREMRAEGSRRADRELRRVTRAVNEAAARVARLEAERVGASHGVNERLVALYKRRRGGYARLLLDQRDLTAIGRLSRGVAAVARLDRARFEAHRRRIRAEREALAELEARRTTVAAAEREARTAREALDRAIAAHSRRIDALDAERDLAARYAGELQVARAALDRRVADLPAAPAPVTSRFARGTLDWPVAGRVIAAFGPGTDPRTGASVARNGIDLAAPAGSAVIAVGDGLVSFAAPFVGFGSLVIVEHGSGTYTLYGYLTDLAVTEGTTVRRGTTVGHSGRTPTGIEALYFELRIDGRPVDPVQWLRSSR